MLKAIGVKIKQLRLENGLTQEELANRCELTKGFISQIENNLTSPSISTLTDILEVLGSSLSEFFDDKEDETYVFTPEDFYEKVDDELKYTTPKGKIVYGGGGIIPDVFVPIDTLNSYSNRLYGRLNDFTFEYIDTHRSELDEWELNDFVENFDKDI
mgnify:CR=1 FL=1